MFTLGLTINPEELSKTEPYSICLEAHCEHRMPGSNVSGAGRFGVLINFMKA